MMDEIIKQLEQIQNDLNNGYDRSRNLSILNTKLEDLIIYCKAFKDKI